MTYLLDLSPELEARLQTLAASRGAEPNAVALQLVAEGLRDVPLTAPEGAPPAQAPAMGSLEDVAAHIARLHALAALPAEERDQVLAAQGKEYAAWCEAPEGQTEWENEIKPWLDVPGPDIDALESEDAAESERLMQERAA